MNVRAVCPNGCADGHFFTTAHVVEEWIVDAEGNFVDGTSPDYVDVAAYPSPENFWSCRHCGAQAQFEEKEA